VSEEKYEAGCDPEKVIAEMELFDLIRVWTTRYSIYNSRGTHDMFEVFCHLVFPKKEERTLAYIAIWLLRDRCSKEEIRRRLGKYGKRKMHPQTVTKYVKYVKGTIYNFVRRTRLVEKFAKELAEEQKLLEDQQLEEDVREIIRCG
jgi:hypothetical protein